MIRPRLGWTEKHLTFRSQKSGMLSNYVKMMVKGLKNHLRKYFKISRKHITIQRTWTLTLHIMQSMKLGWRALSDRYCCTASWKDVCSEYKVVCGWLLPGHPVSTPPLHHISIARQEFLLVNISDNHTAAAQVSSVWGLIWSQIAITEFFKPVMNDLSILYSTVLYSTTVYSIQQIFNLINFKESFPLLAQYCQPRFILASLMVGR